MADGSFVEGFQVREFVERVIDGFATFVLANLERYGKVCALRLHCEVIDGLVVELILSAQPYGFLVPYIACENLFVRPRVDVRDDGIFHN